jgi:hypothetical protein
MRDDEALDAAETRRWAREMQDAAERTSNVQHPRSAAHAAAFNYVVQSIICPECEGSGSDSGALFEREMAPPELEDTLFYDRDNQAWVMDGVYIGCCHSQRCGCYGKLHAGDKYTGRAA